jgi:lipopolysaccharide biosynthesis protein
MFWVNLESLKPLFGLYLMPEDFEVEMGQIDGTMAHAVERAIGVMAQHDNVAMYQVGKLGIKQVTPKQKITDYKYAK